MKCDNSISGARLYEAISQTHQKREAKRQKKTPDSLERDSGVNAAHHF
jgi:hypothetical protein